ncbi:MAG: 16S rRNA (cytidine(1402)-2'-O)-methyltransferase [bacterium]
MKKIQLYLVSVPMGNYDDITLRAINILKNANFIICEEYKEAKKLLHHLQIEGKELVSLNEHNEYKTAEDVIEKVLTSENVALISDCGTPVFNDPGFILVEAALKQDIELIPVPGANSLLPALIASGFKPDRFFYYGWFSPKTEIRQSEMKRLKNMNELIVIYETPYRLKAILTDIKSTFGGSAKIVVAYELTTENEHFFRGAVSDILNKVEKDGIKGNFVLLLDNRKR